MTRFTLLGVPIDPLTQAAAMDWVARAIEEGRPRLVISVNPERIMHARRDPAFAAVLAGADLALADGAGVLWAARRLGHPLPERVAGVDFVKALAARGAAERWRFFFLGGAPGVAEATGRALTDSYPYEEINEYLRLYPDREARVRETLNYFDGINFAPNITCPMLVYVGLADDVCPPETGYALFAAMNEPLTRSSA